VSELVNMMCPHRNTILLNFQHPHIDPERR